MIATMYSTKWNLKRSREIAILLIVERLRVMRVSLETVGNVISRQKRGRELSLLRTIRDMTPWPRRWRSPSLRRENERLDGDNQRRRPRRRWRHEARRDCSGFRIESHAIESAACSLYIAFFLPLSSSFFSVSCHILHHERAHTHA